MGLTKCKLHVKETVYWPELNEQLEKLILNCQLCLKYSQSKCKQPLHMSLGQEISIHPWTKLATDIFHFEGESYLLLVDYTSCFPIVCKLNSMTSQHVINHYKLIFSGYGWPDTLVSDNGPCYASEAFTKTMQEYNVNHITSSPHYQQSNALAENFLQIVKNLFHKGREEGVDLFKTLMIYRNTLLASNLQSPMQMLQSRTVRSQLPMSNAVRHQLGMQTEMLRIQTKNEHLPMHDLCLGQNIMMQDPTSKRWSPVVITRLCKEPKSYQVTTTDGVTYRKMQAHLKPYKPEDKKEQEPKKYHMQSLMNNCDQNTCNNNLAQSRARRQVKPPVKLGV